MLFTISNLDAFSFKLSNLVLNEIPHSSSIAAYKIAILTGGMKPTTTTDRQVTHWLRHTPTKKIIIIKMRSLFQIDLVKVMNNAYGKRLVFLRSRVQVGQCLFAGTLSLLLLCCCWQVFVISFHAYKSMNLSPSI